MTHNKYMKLALDLAVKGQGSVAPNPLVGAVIVRNNKIIGKGYHQYFGGPHAEINAINSVKNPAHIKGSTLYLTLEPCSHFGKTPACAEAICYSGIKKVVIATRDPNPLVKGKGVRLLKAHHINVIEGVLESQARAINAPFFKAQETGLPYVIAKWAMSQNGKMAYLKGERHKGAMALRRHKPKWVTCKKSRDYAKGIRGQCQAVMVGIGTALKDNPGLMANAKVKYNPIRVILDSKARLPLNSKLVKTLSQGPVWVLAADSAPKSRVAGLEKKGVRVFRVPARQGRLDFKTCLRALVRNGVNNLMIEGGAEVLASVFHIKAVDEVYCFISPKIMGGSKTVSARGFFKVDGVIRLNDAGMKYIRPDMLIHGYL